jgi:hypothetical protein
VATGKRANAREAYHWITSMAPLQAEQRREPTNGILKRKILSKKEQHLAFDIHL